MYGNILVAIALDHSRDNSRAFDVARRLSDEGAKVTALNVLEQIPAYAANEIPEEYLLDRVAETETELKAELGGVSGIKAVVIRGHAGRSIVDYATRHDVDCIIVSSHRPGLKDYFLGSTAHLVARHAQCAVHILR